jgi:hypothetical protein
MTTRIRRQKNSHIDDDFDFGMKKTDAYSQGYYRQTKKCPIFVCCIVFLKGQKIITIGILQR